MPLALTHLPVVQLALVLGSWNGRSRDLEARPAVTITALTRGNCNTLLNIAGRNRPQEQTPEGVLDERQPDSQQLRGKECVGCHDQAVSQVQG